ncbi:MAG: tetratricopeptide repeat protein, partial [Polyangiales bacterium]
MCPPPAQDVAKADVDGDTPEAARRSYRRARELAAEGRYRQALLHLRVVSHVYPRIDDRVALWRGELLLEAGEAERACEAFGEAEDSPDSTTRTRAYVSSVRCKIAQGDHAAQRALRSLMRRFPALPQELHLRFELARAIERDGNRTRAAILYRRIDRDHPGSPVAADARTRLAELEADGVRIAPLSTEQRVERAEALVRGGPMGLAKKAVAELEGTRLSSALRTRVALMQARIARVEGRFEDARRALGRARFGSKLPEDVSRADLTDEASDLAAAVEARAQERANKHIRKLKGWRPWLRLPTARLLKIVEMGAAADLTESVDSALEALDRKNVPARYRVDAALMAVGAASDERIVSLLEDARGSRRYGAQARYHYARALERLGRWEDAEREHVAVLSHDDDLGFYAMWSEQRLRDVRRAMLKPPEGGPQGDDVAFADASDPSEPSGPQNTGGEQLVYASLAALEGARPSERWDTDATHAEGGLAVDAPRVDTEALAARVEPIAEAHGEAYP